MATLRVAALAALATVCCAQGPFSLFKLDTGNAFDAVCLDGSPAAFYYSAGSGENADDWVFYFQGGGWCYNAGDCYGRSLTSLGSSVKLPASGGLGLGGLMSNDCNVSPVCNWNKVYFAYCDGNSFSGMATFSEPGLNIEEPVVFNNGTANVPLFFRGRANIDGIVDAVSRNVMGSPNLLKNARNVVETGCSAGGLATYLHADYVRDLVPHSGVYLSMPISGYFLNHQTVEGEYVYGEQIQVIHALSNASTNAACEAHYAATGDTWRCNMAQYVYPFVASPVFVLNSFQDSWQSECIMTSEPVVIPNNTHANGNCSAAPGWRACATAIHNCTVDQVTDGYIPFGQYMTTSFQQINTNKATALGNGGFVTQCHTHCEAQSDGYFTSFAINGVTMAEAASKWIADNIAAKGQAPAAGHWSVDVPLSAVPPYYSNPSCPQA